MKVATGKVCRLLFCALHGCAHPAETMVDLPACYVLDVDDRGVVFMVQRDVRGDTLVLTDLRLDGSPGVTEGNRAFIGKDDWRERPTLRPGSWYWARVEPDSIRIGFVLPLWSISWRAHLTDDRLEGEVRYTSDEMSEPPKSTSFTGRRVPCEP